MFNKTYITKNTPYEKSVSIREMKALTDESVNLLRQMEAKAKGEIIKTIEVKNNLVSGKILVSEDRLNDRYKYEFVCDINGERIVETFFFQKIVVMNQTLRFKVAKCITEIIMNKISTGWK